MKLALGTFWLVFLLASCGPSSVVSNAASDADLVGQAYVRDVDTIVVQRTPVRLNGVDGPELNTRAGQDAKRWMNNHLRGQTVACELNGDRTYDRMVGVCYIQDDTDHNRWIDIGASAIAAGHALDCARYSGGRYRSLETAGARSRINRAGYC